MIVAGYASKAHVEAQAPIVSPYVAPTPTPAIQDKSFNQADIEAYMKQIFASQFRIARAVQHNECGPTNKAYPGCEFITGREYSCGIFQINLMAHWNKVPVGTTFEEKCEYLKNPYNNILVAKSIFADSGWTPWSAYTNGNYLRSL